MASPDFSTGLIKVTLCVLNDPKASYLGPYDYSKDVDNLVRGSTLEDVMNQAQSNDSFRYQASSNGNNGLTVTSVNNRTSGNGQFWALINPTDGSYLDKGIGTYVPHDNEKILFQLKDEVLGQQVCE